MSGSSFDEKTMNRRNALKGILAAPVMSAASAQEAGNRVKGLPPLTIKDVKVIPTSGGRNYRWVFLKIITSEPGLYGIGSANDNYQTQAVVTALEKHLKPWLIGKDPDRIEDLWQSATFKTYWRGGPVNNKVVGAMDEALWDIKGKRAGMPVFEMLGGKAHDAVACYDHVSARTKEQAAEVVAKSMESGYRHIRLQYGEGYGGGGFYRPNEGSRAEGGYQGMAFDEDLYVDTIPAVFEYVRSKVGTTPKLLHDVHSKLTGTTALLFSKRMEPFHMLFLEDVLPPEQVAWYREIRKVSATPQAVGEVFTNSAEYYPLITERVINYIRCRVTAIGGISAAKKLATLCEVFGVKTAFQEGGENDPVNQLAAYHVDLSSSAFGIQEENHFPDVAKEILPGTAEIRKGYMYGSHRPGLGIEINEELAAKYPITEPRNGGAYGTDRSLDGTVVIP
jgi:mannonate dehydratase